MAPAALPQDGPVCQIVEQPLYGHLHRFDMDTCTRWVAVTGQPFEVHEHHGGWLVIETG